MAQSRKGLFIFAVLIIMAFMIGSYILTATFFGVISLIGFIALIESIPPAKWLVARSSTVLDIIIFTFTIMATMNYGLNIAASLTVAGLGYTLIYAPYLREQRQAKKYTKKNRSSGSHNRDWR